MLRWITFKIWLPPNIFYFQLSVSPDCQCPAFMGCLFQAVTDFTFLISAVSKISQTYTTLLLSKEEKISFIIILQYLK